MPYLQLSLGLHGKPIEKPAALDMLKELQQDNRRVFRSNELSRVHRERLVENGFLLKVLKGWLAGLA